MNAQGTRCCGFPKQREDIRAQQFLCNADADVGNRGRLLVRFDIETLEVTPVKQALQFAGAVGVQIAVSVGDLRATVIEEAQIDRSVRVVSGDDEIEMVGHVERLTSLARRDVAAHSSPPLHQFTEWR